MIQQPTSHQYTNPPCMTYFLNDILHKHLKNSIWIADKTDEGNHYELAAPGKKPQVLLHTLKSKLHSSMGHTLINSSTRVLIYNTAKTLETRRCQVVSANRT